MAEQVTDQDTEPSILLDAYALVHGDRNASYGDPADDYSRVVALFEALTGHCLTPEEGVLFPLCMKLARIGTALDQGFPPEGFRDSVTDGAGYLDCFWWTLNVLADDNQDDEPEGDEDDE